MSKDKEINEEGREDLFGDCQNSGMNRMLAEDVNNGLMCGSHLRAEPQDADYSYVPSLSNELEVLILARVPRAEHWKFYLLNKYFLQLLRSGELFKIRRQIGLKESTVFMLPIGDSYWWAFDGQFKSWKKLPRLPADDCFRHGDKESISAGSHLIVSGKEMEGTVVWRFELETSRWYRGPRMISPRCLFASATCGTYAFVAGGKVTGFEGDSKVLDSAEKYNPETKSWHPLPRMHQKREFCSGCFMDNKFYVIEEEMRRETISLVERPMIMRRAFGS